MTVCVWWRHEAVALIQIQNVHYPGSCFGDKNAVTDLIVFGEDDCICWRTRNLETP